ncbi:MAG: hypothetical protein ACQETM_06705 [Bacteroidota bacterium]
MAKHRKTKYTLDNPFQRRRVRDVTLQGSDGPRRSLRGIDQVHTGIAVLMMAIGLFSVSLVLMDMVLNQWFASILSFSGSLLTIFGAWLLFDAVKERKSVDNLVRNAIMRALRHKN